MVSLLFFTSGVIKGCASASVSPSSTASLSMRRPGSSLDQSTNALRRKGGGEEGGGRGGRGGRGRKGRKGRKKGREGREEEKGRRRECGRKEEDREDGKEE